MHMEAKGSCQRCDPHETKLRRTYPHQDSDAHSSCNFSVQCRGSVTASLADPALLLCNLETALRKRQGIFYWYMIRNDLLFSKSFHIC